MMGYKVSFRVNAKARVLGRTFLLLVLGLLVSAVSVAASTNPAEELAGIWVAEEDFGPELHGTLTIARTHRGWQAEISNYLVDAEVFGEQINFSVPGERGWFRGGFEQGYERIVGHWIQPRVQSAGGAFASPVILEQVSDSLWQGEVVPMPDRMTIYFSIAATDDSLARVVVLNPQVNFGRFFNINRIMLDTTLTCNNLHFLGFGSAGTGESDIVGTFHNDSHRFSIDIPDAGRTFTFEQVVDSNCAFFPRPRLNPIYTYRPPLDKGDGWEVATLAEVDMAIKPIEELIRMIAANNIDSINVPLIHALLIARHGRLVVEEYFHGYDGETPHDTRSASKSVTSTLVGMAIEGGEPVSLNTRVYETMYDGHFPDDLDPRAARMTLRDLLTMSSGLACYDADPISPGNEDAMQSQTDQLDWTKFTLELPMEHEPGEHAAYCSGGMNLAAAVLSKATGEWLPDYFYRNFARPLDIGLYHINLTPTGEAYGGGGLRIKARDFMKMGQLMLDEGRWHGKQLLSREWAHEAVSAITEMWGEQYGLGWWLIEYPYKERTVTAFYAGGNGGQYIIGIPELDLLVLIYGGNYGQSVMHISKRQYVPEFILKAVE